MCLKIRSAEMAYKCDFLAIKAGNLCITFGLVQFPFLYFKVVNASDVA